MKYDNHLLGDGGMLFRLRCRRKRNHREKHWKPGDKQLAQLLPETDSCK